MWYDNLKEKNMWANFEALSQIPRESGNEEGVRNFLLAWAKDHNIKALADKTGNVIMYKDATKGYENRKPTLLQGHMDMVCVKTADSKHDFTKDPIEIVSDGMYIRAKDTSLGADDGIAIAMTMDLLEDEKLAHGPLEALFTISEETGLSGVYGIEPELFSSRRLINIDSEEEGVIYIGCAGGIEVKATQKASYKETSPNDAFFTLSASGLLGGHSGGEIHKQRANAIKLLARIMHRLSGYRLCSFTGGTKRNVIPSFASLSFVIDKSKAETVKSVFKQAETEIMSEYHLQDPGIILTLKKEKKVPEIALKKKLSRNWIDALFLAPHGVQGMSFALPGVVETSSNIAIVSFEEDTLTMISSVRSSVESAKNELAYTIGAAFEDHGAKVTYEGAYPAWTPDPTSPLALLVAKEYKLFTKKKPVVTAIHAGLECGIINSLIPGMDSVSLGPNLFDVHSVNEHVEAASADRLMAFLRYLIPTLD